MQVLGDLFLFFLAFELVKHYQIDRLDKHFSLVYPIFNDIKQVNIEVEREDFIFNESEGEDGHKLDEHDKQHVIWRIIVGVFGCIEITIANCGHGLGHEIDLVDVKI